MKNKKIIITSLLFMILFSMCSFMVVAEDYTLTSTGSSGSSVLVKTYAYRDSNDLAYLLLGASARMYNAQPDNPDNLGSYGYIGADNFVPFGGSSYYSGELVINRNDCRLYRSPITGSVPSLFHDCSSTYTGAINYGGVTDNYIFMYHINSDTILRYEFGTHTITQLSRTEAVNKIVGIDSFYDSDSETWYYVLLTSNSDESAQELLWYDEEGVYKKTDTISTALGGANIYSCDNGFYIDRTENKFGIVTGNACTSFTRTEPNGYYSDSVLVPPQTAQNFIQQKIIVVKQETPVTLTGVDFATVASASLNITQNFTGYATATFNSLSTLPNGDLECRININNNYYNTLLRRTDDNINNYGSWYLLSAEIIKEPQILNASLDCKVNSGSYEISSMVGELHFLEDVPSFSAQGNYTGNENTYTKVPLGNITVPNEEAHEENNYFFVYESTSELLYNSDSFAEIIIEIDGENFTTAPRTGSSGDYGVYGKYYGKVIEGFNRNFTVNGYVKGDVEGNYKVFGKLFLLTKNETYTENNINIDITTDTFTPITSFNYYSEEISNIVVDTVLPITSNSGADELQARFKLETEGGVSIYRTVKTDTETGILMLGDVFTNVLNNTMYNITLEARAEHSDITINNASVIMYKSQLENFTAKGINITAYNSQTNESIQEFTILSGDGVQISTTNGVIFFSDVHAIESFTFSSNNYYNEIVTNHDLTINLNQSIDPIIIFNPTLSGVCGEQITVGLNNDVTKTINVTYLQTPPINETVNVYSSKNTLLPITKQMFNKLVEGVVVSNEYIFTALNWDTGFYNLSTSHDIRGVEQEKVSSCEFEICKNDWVRKPTACINGIRTINYTDVNNCNAQYYPSDYGDDEYCTKDEDNRKQLLTIFVIMFVVICLLIFLALKMNNIIFIVLGLGISIMFTIASFTTFESTLVGVVGLLLSLALAITGLVAKINNYNN